MGLFKKKKDTNRSVLFRKYGNVVQKFCEYCNVNKLDWIELVWQGPSSKGNLKGTLRQWIMTVNIRHIHNYLDPFPPINLSSTQSLLYKVEQLDLLCKTNYNEQLKDMGQNKMYISR